MLKAFVQRFVVPLVYPALKSIGTPMKDPSVPELDADGNPVPVAVVPVAEGAVDADGNPVPALPGAAVAAIGPDGKPIAPVKETMADKPSVLQEVGSPAVKCLDCVLCGDVARSCYVLFMRV